MSVKVNYRQDKTEIVMAIAVSLKKAFSDGKFC